MKFKEKRQLILSGNLYKVILTIALPLMVSNLIQRAYTLTDMYFLGTIGSNEVAAITFVDPILTGILAIGMGLSIPMLSMVSQNIGAHDYDKARESIGHLLYLALIISSVIVILGLSSSTILLKILRLKGDLLNSSSTYLKVVLSGTIFTFINACYVSVKQAEGDAMRPLYMNVASLLMNIILNPIFIFQMKLGILGAAIATVLSQGLLAGYGMWDMFTGSGLKIERRHLTITKDELRRIIAIGLPAIITKLASPFGNILINTHAVTYGSGILAAVGIGNKINSIFFSLNSSLSTTMTTITGQNLGNNNIKRVRKAVKKMAVVCTIISIASVAFIFIFMNEIVGIFTKDPEVIIMAKDFLKMITPTIFMWGVYQIVSGVYQGAGYTKISMYITLIRLWVLRIPLVFILDRFIGGRSIWYSTAVATNVIGVVSILFYLSNKWAKKNKYMN